MIEPISFSVIVGKIIILTKVGLVSVVIVKVVTLPRVRQWFRSRWRRFAKPGEKVIAATIRQKTAEEEHRELVAVLVRQATLDILDFGVFQGEALDGDLEATHANQELAVHRIPEIL